MSERVIYNCKDILIGLGPYRLTGYADDAFLSIEDMAEEAAPTAAVMARLLFPSTRTHARR